nr:hypothetical protein [Tanacetum cinerariifolium]
MYPSWVDTEIKRTLAVVMDEVMMAAAGEGDGRRRVAGVGVNGGGDEGCRWWMRDGDGLEVKREVVWLP